MTIKKAIAYILIFTAFVALILFLVSVSSWVIVAETFGVVLGVILFIALIIYLLESD